MAKIKFYKDFLDNKFDEVEIKEGTLLVDAINNYCPENPYKDTIVECYDATDQKTFFEPVSTGDTYDVIAKNDKEELPLDYIIQKDDYLTVTFLPTSGDPVGDLKKIGKGIGDFCHDVGEGFKNVWNGGGKYFGFIGAAVGGLWGIGSATVKAVKKTVNKKPASSPTEEYNPGSFENGKDLEKIPSVRGANNQALLDNVYPFVLGKHLITPFVVGNPITTYSGPLGKDSYIKMLLCAGYAPLKLTDFKLDESILAMNRSVRPGDGKRTLLKGVLGDNPGEIDELWHDNDIHLEILQHKPGEPYNRGTIYPTVQIDKEINANCIFIADKEVEAAAGIVYKGASFPTNFRTNNVYFTESCPHNFSLNLVCDSGLFRSRSHTDSKNNTKTVYSSIPLWYCIQYRYYNEKNAPSSSEGKDYYDWITPNCSIIGKNGETVNLNATYTSSEKTRDLNTHEGNEFNNSNINNDWVGKQLVNFEKVSGEDYMTQMRFSINVDVSSTAGKCFEKGNTVKGIEVRIIRVSPCYINEVSSHESNKEVYGPWSYADSIGVRSIVTEIFDEEKYKKSKVVSKIYNIPDDKDVDRFCYIALSAKADNNGYINQSLQKISCIAEAFSPTWDLKTKRWLPEGIRKQRTCIGYYKASVPLSDLDTVEKRNKHLTDRVDRELSSNVNEVYVTHKEAEEAINKGLNWTITDICYGYYSKDVSYDAIKTEYGRSQNEQYRVDKDLKAHEVLVTYEELTKARRDGRNWTVSNRGSNFADVIKSEVLANDYLIDSCKKYNDNSVASGAMLAMVGPQSGLASLGYEDISLSSFGEWYEDTLDVRDGSLDENNNEISIAMKANAYIYQAEKLEDILAKISAAGRAIYTYDDSGKIRVIMDKPVDYPVGVITDQNCISSQSNFSYSEIPAGLAVGFFDENDGYDRNMLYCWADGNSYSNYKGQVSSMSIPFVTDPRQVWSLGRYILANMVLNKEIITRKVGPEGVTYELGDVVMVQGNTLEVGEGSARIHQFIRKDDLVIGFITDGVFTFYSNEDGSTPLGISIMQPRKYGKSRVVVDLALAPKTSEPIMVNGEMYQIHDGPTNVVILDKPIRLTSDNVESDVEYTYNFTTGDLCLFGELKKTSEPFRIIKIKQEANNTFTETLLKYNEKTYKYGDKLPSFPSYRRTPVVTRDPVSLTDVPNNLVSLNKENAANNQHLQQRMDKIFTNHVVLLYKKSEEALAETGITATLRYYFDLDKYEWLEGSDNGWKFTFKEANDSMPRGHVYSTTATVISNTVYGDVEPTAWVDPHYSVGSDGLDGFNLRVSKPSLLFITEADGNIAVPSTVDVDISIDSYGEAAKFDIGEVATPPGMEIVVDQEKKKLTITSLVGTQMLEVGTIKVPVTYTPNLTPINLTTYINYSKVKEGQKGEGIKKVLEFYLVSKEFTGITLETPGWSPKIPEMTLDLPYLWNYEEIVYTDGTSTKNDPRIASIYKAGNGVKTIENFYLRSEKSAGITIEGNTWSKTPPIVTSREKYLWNYERVTYTEKDPVDSDPRVIGIYGQGSSVISAQVDNLTFTNEEWESFGAAGYEKVWDSIKNSEEFKYGDTIVLNGTVSDRDNIKASIFATVQEVLPPPAPVTTFRSARMKAAPRAVSGSVRATSTTIIKGEKGNNGLNGPRSPMYLGLDNPNGYQPRVEGDYYLNSADRKIYQWENGDYKVVELPNNLYNTVINDLIPTVEAGDTEQLVVVNAYVKNLVANSILSEQLFAAKIKITEGGAILGGDRYNEKGELVNADVDGFYLGSDGAAKFRIVGDRGNLMLGEGAGIKLDDEGSTGSNNTLIGIDSGKNLTNGSNNICNGYRAGYSITTGHDNICNGNSAGKCITTGQGNICNGSGAGYNITIGSENICNGVSAGSRITVGSDNICNGYQAGLNITTGNGNICNGRRTGFNITKGSFNICNGYEAGYKINTGNGNICNGFKAGYNITTGHDNICNGYNAGFNITTSNYNVCTGYNAGYNITTGSNNICNGYNAGYFITTGSNNICNGYQAGYSITTGENNICNGYNAGFNITEGSNNICNGIDAGTNITTGSDNICNGYKAGICITTGHDNICNGHQAGYNITTGNNNICNGYNAGYFITTGSFNICNGYNAGYNINTGHDNICNGYQAGQYITTGNNNICNGSRAGYGITTGSNNICNGYQTGFNITTGENNICNGFQTGFNITTGSNNICNGYQAGYSITTSNNNICNGLQAGYSITTGNDNICNGDRAGYKITEGTNNNCTGHIAGGSITTGHNNICNGFQAGYGITTGDCNVCIGENAGYTVVDGYGNVFIGRKAGELHSNGNNNVAIGRGAGEDMESGHANVFIGVYAGWTMKKEDNAIIIGSTVGYPQSPWTRGNGIINIGDVFTYDRDKVAKIEGYPIVTQASRPYICGFATPDHNDDLIILGRIPRSDSGNGSIIWIKGWTGEFDARSRYPVNMALGNRDQVSCCTEFNYGGSPAYGFSLKACTYDDGSVGFFLYFNASYKVYSLEILYEGEQMEHVNYQNVGTWQDYLFYPEAGIAMYYR